MSASSPSGTGMLRLVAAILLIGGADPGHNLQVVGLGEHGIRSRGDRARNSAGKARRIPRRMFHWGRTLAGRRVYRDRGLGTPLVRSGTLVQGAAAYSTQCLEGKFSELGLDA